jgi:hypothetical protein
LKGNGLTGAVQTGNAVSQHDVAAGSGQGVLHLADRVEHPVVYRPNVGPVGLEPLCPDKIAKRSAATA